MGADSETRGPIMERHINGGHLLTPDKAQSIATTNQRDDPDWKYKAEPVQTIELSDGTGHDSPMGEWWMVSVSDEDGEFIGYL